MFWPYENPARYAQSFVSWDWNCLRAACGIVKNEKESSKQAFQIPKQRDEHGRLQGVELKAIWGSKAELNELLGKSTACIERSNLTARIFNARLTHKTLAFSKNLQAHENAVTWEDAYYNLDQPSQRTTRQSSG